MMWRIFWISLFSIAVVGLAIALLLVPGPSNHPPDGRVRADFESIRSALITYKINARFYPSTEQGLGALVEKPTNEPIPNDWVKIADKVPTDPWQREYQYRRLAEGADPGFELRSLGPDGKLHTKDDLSSLD
jgi:general secretion pathway protein G